MESLFGAYKVDIGIYGVAGVDEDGTLLDFYEEEVRARQIIRENSRSSYLVLDHSKFGRAAHVRGGRIDEAQKIFCDRTPPASIIQLIHRSGAELIICKRDAAT
jgi:DeoR family glycerol-3-phosphate regulon repressor